MKRLIPIILIMAVLTGCGKAAVSEPSAAVTAAAAAEHTAPVAPSPEVSPEVSSNTVAEPDPFEYVEKLFSGNVLEIEITASEENWDYLQEHALESPWIAADITIDGETFPNVGIRTKGNTSLSSVARSDSSRYSLKVNFGKYENGQTCFGLDKMALNNIYADNTYLKEYMSYHLFQYMQVPASLCAFCRICVNGEYYGFCLAVEDTDKSFLARYAGPDNKLEAYKPDTFKMGGGPGGPGGGFPNPPEGGFPPRPGEIDWENIDWENFERPQFPTAPGGMDRGVSLQYTDDDPTAYSGIFENSITKISDRDKARVIGALKAISEGEDLELYINVDEVLRYTACNVFLVNMDSYFSMMGHNYVLVENRGQLSMVPWDYNLSFGTHNVGTAADAVNYAVDTVFSGTTAEQRPIVGKLLEVDEYRERYHKYLRQICEDYIGGGIFNEEIDRVTGIIDGYVQKDSTSFGGYDAFLAGVPALRLFGTLRAESVLGQLNGTIPSWKEEQYGSENLVDASELDLSLLGSMGMGRRPPAAWNPASNE